MNHRRGEFVETAFAETIVAETIASKTAVAETVAPETVFTMPDPCLHRHIAEIPPVFKSPTRAG